MPDIPESTRSNALSVAVIVPDATRRKTLVRALGGHNIAVSRQLSSYPPPGDLPEISQTCDVVIVDLNQDLEQAIQTIETICSHNASTTVMAYSSSNDPTPLRRTMQAGARDLLIDPLLPETVRETFARTSSRRHQRAAAAGKVMLFVPTKGGVGVTTLASNFALALTKVSGARVVVVDMDLQLGEIALGLGLNATFSVVDALLNSSRLDRDFLSTLLIRHPSGLAVLGAPESFHLIHSSMDDGAEKLFRILREEFDYVVVDIGTCHGQVQELLFGLADTLYLITEMNFPALRNSHRLISYLSAKDGSRQLEVVVNRYNSRHGKIDESSAKKALTRPVRWRIPNAYAAVRDSQDSGVPLAMGDSPIARVLVEMAKTASGKSVAPEKPNKPFSIFSLRGLTDQAEA